MVGTHGDEPLDNKADAAPEKEAGPEKKEEDPKSGCLSGNCQNGQSTYIWEDDGSQFTGNYSAGKRNGAGIYHYGKGGSYEGNFKDGLRSGQGTYYFPNGSKYVGNWQADKRKGFGTLYRKGGETIKGTWGNGKLLKRSN